MNTVRYYSSSCYSGARIKLSTLLPCLLCNQQQTLNTDVLGSVSKTFDNRLPPLTVCKSQPRQPPLKTVGV